MQQLVKPKKINLMFVQSDWFKFEVENKDLTTEELLQLLSTKTLQEMKVWACGPLNDFYSPNRSYYYSLYCCITCELAKRYAADKKNDNSDSISSSSEC